jgi:competence protein ComEC
MATIFLVGLALGRQQSGVAALAAAAIVMTALDPGAARDVGFQLSLAATAGLLVLGPWFAWLLARPLPAAARPMLPDALLNIVAWTLASTLATTPLLWLYFGEFSVVGVVANVVAQPIFAVALGLSLATALLGLAWEPLGWLAGVAAWYPLAFMNEVAATLGSLGWASVDAEGATGSRVAVLYGLLLAAGGCAFLRPPPMRDEYERPSGLPLRRYGYAAVAGALLVGGWWFTVRPMAPDQEMTVAFLDVGQGDAALVTTPGGQQVLIDGGPSGIELMRELGAAMPHWDRSIDAVILSHPQQDHLAGLVELGRRFEVAAVYDAGARNRSATFAAYDDEFGSRILLRAGDAFELDGVRFEVLWPHSGQLSGDLNQDSLVVRVEYGGRSLLFTGDIESTPQLALLAATRVGADVLKVPHHGAATSDVAFFEAVDAGIAVVSVGTNTFGHPREETLEALAPARILRTDEDGRIVVTISEDGRIRYRVEHP